MPQLSAVAALHNVPYDETIAYGNVYSKVLTHLEEQIDSIYPQLNEEQTQALDNLIFTVYHNNNRILENADWLKLLNDTIRPQNTNVQELVAQYLKDHSPAINQYSPKKAGGLFCRASLFFALNFKPQLGTNIPSIKNTSLSSELKTIEYRFGTQAQRHQGQVRISPLFKHWLRINAQKAPADQTICHIYFNNLALDRDRLDPTGYNERELSLSLHELEEDPSLKTAVITLPAGKALMDADQYKKTHDCLSYAPVFKELFSIARDQHHSNGIVDLKISPQIRTLLFGTPQNESQILKDLLHRSFATMGIKPGDTFSTAQKQAVWLHFIKFELTYYIQNTLQATSCNFACKDAIDRGALSSLYLKLHLSLELNQTISQAEFELDLNIAAANVKGRGMNFHRRLLWNAIDTFVNAHYNQLLNDKSKSWLIYWRDMNCPHSRVEQLLALRLKQFESRLDALPSNQQTVKEQGLKLLAAVNTLFKQKTNGQRLLLEVISRSQSFLSETPSKESIHSYKNLAKELQVNYPKLLIIAGYMLAFLGMILCSEPLMNYGLAKVKTGLFVEQRKELCNYIKDIVSDEERRDTLKSLQSVSP